MIEPKSACKRTEVSSSFPPSAAFSLRRLADSLHLNNNNLLPVFSFFLFLRPFPPKLCYLSIRRFLFECSKESGKIIFLI